MNELLKVGPLNLNSSDPQVRREIILEKRLRISLIFNALQIISLLVVVVIFTFKPIPIITVDKDTGILLGEYQTTAHRSFEELIAGCIYFLNHRLSLNSSTIFDDLAIAKRLSSEKVAKEMLLLLMVTNGPELISQKNQTSFVDYDLKKMKVLSFEDGIGKFEFFGKVILKGDKTIHLPFRIILEVGSTKISKYNTRGIEIIYFKEYNYEPKIIDEDGEFKDV